MSEMSIVDQLLLDPPKQYKYSIIHMDGYQNSIYSELQKYTPAKHRSCKLLKYQDHKIDEYIKDNMDKMYVIQQKQPDTFRSRYSLLTKILHQTPFIFVYDYYDRQFHIKISNAYDEIWDAVPDWLFELRKYTVDIDRWADDNFDMISPILDKLQMFPIIIFDKEKDLDGIIVVDFVDFICDLDNCFSSLGVNLLNSEVVKTCLSDFFDNDGIIKPYCWYYFINDTRTDKYKIVRDLKKSPKKKFNEKGELADAAGYK